MTESATGGIMPWSQRKEALARGEKRVLRVTTTGELHSYAEDEMRSGSHRDVARPKSAPGGAWEF